MLPGCSVCTPEAGSCCAANGTPGCSNISCCQSVCGIKPECCDDSGGGWDLDCVALAVQHCDGHCGACGSSFAGDCCAPNGTPFCGNSLCCGRVCDEDPYCCEVAWDECCVNRAVEDCPDLPGCHAPPLQPPILTVPAAPVPPHPACQPDAGDCFAGNSTPGCNDLNCCAQMCYCDPFCCEVHWDQYCVIGCGPFCDCNSPCGFTDGCQGAQNLCGTQPLPAFSCQGNCGSAAMSGCWCDEACCHYGDCCIDKAYKCLGCTPPDEDAIPISQYSTCLGACSDKLGTGGGGCSCDVGCCERGDCCPDKHNHCGGCTPKPSNPADLTGTGLVNVFDLLQLLANWGDCQFERCFVMETCEGDFNHDGVVNVFDLLFMLANWGGA